MLRLILIILLFLLSLLTVFRAPTNLLWLVSILVTEFCWVFFFVVVFLLVWRTGESKYFHISLVIGLTSLIFYSVPVVGAFRIAGRLKNLLSDNKIFVKKEAISSPYNPVRMLSGLHAKSVPYKTFTYDPMNQLRLDFYHSLSIGKRPCVIVVHGGSWAGGDSQQLPELNSFLAKKGFHVATINYRLAPDHKYPAPIEDLQTALNYLRSNAAELLIDTGNFVLLGRSAGGQIVLSAAYHYNDPTIKGVISFYGPTDMVWGYANPTNPLVLNSKKVMEDYLGGTYQQVPEQYVNSSPTESAHTNSPPALLMYGENDPLVSHLHGVRLDKKLDSLQVKHYDVYLPWATYGFDYTLNGPAGQLSTWCVLRFLQMVMSKN